MYRQKSENKNITESAKAVKQGGSQEPEAAKKAKKKKKLKQ